LLSGKREAEPVVRMVPETERKDIKEMMLRVVVDSSAGDRVRINLPMALVQVAMDCGMELPMISGSDALKQLDWTQIMAMISQGFIGNLVEVDSADGSTVRIFVE